MEQTKTWERTRNSSQELVSLSARYGPRPDTLAPPFGLIFKRLICELDCSGPHFVVSWAGLDKVTTDTEVRGVGPRYASELVKGLYSDVPHNQSTLPFSKRVLSAKSASKPQSLQPRELASSTAASVAARARDAEEEREGAVLVQSLPIHKNPQLFPSSWHHHERCQLQTADERAKTNGR
eukprot:2059113-Rhodomonas_salina.2